MTKTQYSSSNESECRSTRSSRSISAVSGSRTIYSKNSVLRSPISSDKYTRKRASRSFQSSDEKYQKSNSNSRSSISGTSTNFSGSSRRSSVKSDSNKKRCSYRKNSNDCYKSRKSVSRSPSGDNSKRHMKYKQVDPSNCVGVFGLPYSTNEDTLYDTFKEFGTIKSVRVIMDRIRNESLGYGFVTYEELTSAKKAVKRANGTRVGGRIIRIDYSISKSGNFRSFSGNRQNKNRRDSSRGNRRKQSSRSRSRSRSNFRRRTPTYD